MLVLALVALPLALACGGDEQPARSGISTATPRAEPTSDVGASPTVEGTASPEATPTGTRTAAPPPDAEPTSFEADLAAASGEDPREVAGALAFLDGECTDDRAALGRFAEQTWRILNEQRGVRVPVVAIINRVIAALPIDGREVACESLFASVVTELSRQ